MWEYLIYPIEGMPSNEKFDELGNQGWELVSVDYEIAYFKRFAVASQERLSEGDIKIVPLTGLVNDTKN